MTKLLILVTLAAAIMNVDAGAKKMMRMMALNGGMMNGANPAMMGGGGFAPAMMGGGGFAPAMMGGGGFAPAMVGGGGFAPGMMAGGGAAGFAGQPFAQFAPRVPYAFQPPAPPPAPMGVPNMYAIPAANAAPYIGMPQMAGFDPFQQQAMGQTAGGAMAQRFKRQIMRQRNTPMDTQIPTPPGMQTTTIPCDANKKNN